MILGIAQDISDTKKALDNLQKSEEKYRNLYDSMMDAYSRTDLEGNILECNKHYLDMLGYTADEIKKLKYTDITPEKWHEMERKIKEEQVIKRGYSDVYEKEYVKKDGTIFPVELRGFLLRDSNGNPEGMWSIVRDITERKKTGEELRKIERLESLGLLAGGIAHDFNNLLTGILGNLSLVKMAEGEDRQNILDEAKQASIQAKNLTQQLLTFSKGGEPIKGKVAIEDIIRESAEFSLHGSNVRCQYDFANDLWKVEVDKGQMSQVIDNLVINSNQAMPEGGKIHIKAENVIFDKENSFNLSEGKYIKITLQDEGIGMSEEFLPKIFDPYFSTKQEGSGLGLATVYSIIQKHNGYITVESQTGKGTTFLIYLPAIEEKLSEKKKKKETKKTLTGEGKILIMDDEKIVRKAVGGMLRSLGYTVELAEKGEEAIAKYKEAKNAKKSFDAVILDLTVPGGLGGKKTMEKLLQIDPDVKAIVSSGYSTDPVMANYEKHGFKAVVAKPFDMEELNKAIEKVLK
jgi:PAS domain S-box-containing protein